MMRQFKGLIDAGYLSFVYGTREGGNWGGWGAARLEYKDFLMVMDSRTSVRRNYFPTYKSRRQQRRQDDPEKQRIHDQVEEFRTILREDPLVNTVEVDGFEADDIVAYLFMMGYGRERVIAEDKDLLQVPGLRRVMTNHFGEKNYRHLKLPQYAEAPWDPADYVLLQCLFGDKTDSIPRLLPSIGSHAKAEYQQINANRRGLDRYEYCLNRYGNQFLVNMVLVLVPSPFLLANKNIINQPSTFMRLVASGLYWRQETLDEHYLKVIEESLCRELEW